MLQRNNNDDDHEDEKPPQTQDHHEKRQRGMEAFLFKPAQRRRKKDSKGRGKENGSHKVTCVFQSENHNHYRSRSRHITHDW